MARVKGAMMTRKRRNKTLKLAKSYWGSKSTHFKMAKQAVKKSGVYAYIGRKQKKRDFRRLWIARISAAVKPYGMNYSRCVRRSRRDRQEGPVREFPEITPLRRGDFFAIFIPAFCIFAHCVLYYFYQTVENLPGQRELIRQAVCKRTGGNRHEEYHYDQP